ncbi:hypothetical protein OYT88_07785 [Sporolactobacillus sp. CQH2019]|uniref:hypothetical protein n=1 Tax=Sporolactobacillus sp. CQH2019 TaxID=3023512 RepID=UPI0023676354|nr:hypothetical protein [Sporolactobacillus sp. CQH2019]MDD9148447.1 hypothetical protein [Sporolactobacillus sp. CQH2019]
MFESTAFDAFSSVEALAPIGHKPSNICGLKKRNRTDPAKKYTKREKTDSPDHLS